MKVEVCEAVIEQRTVQKGTYAEPTSLDGHAPGLRVGQVNQPEIVNTTIDCSRCGIHIGFESEGPGYAAINDSERRVYDVVQGCPKLLEFGFSAGEIPAVNLPNVSVI